MRNISFLRTSLGLLLILTFFTFSSCSKDSDKNVKDQKTGENVSTSTEFTETNEDLLTVDYTYFYNQLSGHGEWVEMSSKDLGLNIKPGSSSSIDPAYHKFISELLGVKTAHAQTGADLFMTFVWRPTNDLAASMVIGNEDKEYVPYNNGQWVNTDNGWYFKANTPQEDLTSHYGRWAYDPNVGWVWLPGKVWSPAWVEWRENADYVAWAPIPPGSYIQNDAITTTIVNENRYTVVEKRSFIEPSVYKYRYQYVENKNKIMIKEMTKTDGVMIKNKTVINKGPEVSGIEKVSGKKIEQYKIKKTDKPEGTGITAQEIDVYNPEFKKSVEVKKDPVSKPDKFVSYDDAKKISKEEKEQLKEQDKVQKEDQKEIKKEEKEQKKEDKELKKEDKSKDKEDKGNKNQDKEQGKDKKDKSDKQDKDKGNKNSDDNVDKGNKKNK